MILWRKAVAILMVLLLTLTLSPSLADTSAPPAMPDGQTAGGSGGPGGTPPSGAPDGQAPNGGPGGQAPGGGPGGQSAAPETYAAVSTYQQDAVVDGETVESTGVDENAMLVTGGTVTIQNATVSRVSADSAGGDSSSFYGVGAALLATGGIAKVSDSVITTDAGGGAGVFAYGDGTVYVSDTRITTSQGTSGGIHVAGGGTLHAQNLTVETSGSSSAAIRSDRGGGTMTVDGGSYTANGSGSPALYCTADISVHGATLTATGSEALCLEGLNTVRLFDSDLSGNMPDSSQNDNTWTVILYQSMSGDSQVGKGRFEMSGGSLATQNGGLFYTTNTESEFVVSGVAITPAENNPYFLRCTGNSNQRGWGASGANGSDCTFTAVAQQMPGNVIWDSISDLDLYVTSGSALVGAVVQDESNAGQGGDGYCKLYIDDTSTWTVTGDSTLTSLCGAGAITDAEGNLVSIVGVDGTVYVQGASAFTVTVSQYSPQYDGSGAGSVSSWDDIAATAA